MEINKLIEYKYKNNIYYYLLLNVRFGSLLGLRGLLLMYMWGENSERKPRDPSPRLLGLACWRLRGACESPVVLFYLTF